MEVQVAYCDTPNCECPGYMGANESDICDVCERSLIVDSESF